MQKWDPYERVWESYVFDPARVLIEGAKITAPESVALPESTDSPSS